MDHKEYKDEAVGESSEQKAVTVADSYYGTSLEVAEDNDNRERYYEIFDKEKNRTRIWSVISLALAVIALALSAFGWIGLVFAILAPVFSVVSRVYLKFFDGIAIAGLIIGIFALVISGTVIAVTLIFGGLEGLINM
jgi:hypothetical protein